MYVSYCKSTPYNKSEIRIPKSEIGDLSEAKVTLGTVETTVEKDNANTESVAEPDLAIPGSRLVFAR